MALQRILLSRLKEKKESKKKKEEERRRVEKGRGGEGEEVVPAVRSLSKSSFENINFHSGRRVERPVRFFTRSHNEEEGEEAKEGAEEESSRVSPSDLILM